MTPTRKNIRKTALPLAIFSSLVLAMSFLSTSPGLSYAQTTENSPPQFSQFRFDLTVEENTSAGTNISEPVAAIDPDAGDRLYYALTGGDVDAFTLNSSTGQLRTRVPLDFETKDEYWLHVGVRDGKGPRGGTDLVADDAALVIIKVINMDEPGTVSLDWRQPWLGVALHATFADPDGEVSAEAWQWSRADSRSGSYEDIAGAEAATYSYSPVQADEGKYLRVTASYTDPQGSGKTARYDFTDPAKSVVASKNVSPSFPSTTTTLSIIENTPAGSNIGSPVRATGGPVLLYTLGGADATSFSIDSATGQLRTKAPLNYEGEKQSYSVTVTATNTSMLSDSIVVTINVTDVPVEIHGASRINFSEGEFVYSPVLHRYTIEPRAATLTLTGTDARHFSLSGSLGLADFGSLTFNEEPDYETPRDSGRNNVYDVAINADKEINGTTHRARLNVQIVVTDYNEQPLVTGPEAVTFVEQTTGQVARFTATEPERDPLRWEVQDTDDWTFFQISQSGVLTFREPPDYENPGVQGSVYEVVILARSGMNAATDGKRVQVTVTDGDDPPLFAGGYSQTRTVPENTPANSLIGEPVSATDLQGSTIHYSFRGSDARFFSFDRVTGQLKTRTALNYEVRNSYSVTVRASDGTLSSNASVTIHVVNLDEAGGVTFSPSRPVARAAFTATLTDPDGAITGKSWTWEISDDQTNWTAISNAGSATYTPTDDDVGKYLRASVSYTDGQGSGKSIHASPSGAVNNGPNRSPYFPDLPSGAVGVKGLQTDIEVDENTEAGVAIGSPVAAIDPDGDALAYSLRGANAGHFEIETTSGQLKTRGLLDFETLNRYTVTVYVRDGKNTSGRADSSWDASKKVTISVLNEDEEGEITFSSLQPQTQAELTASLSDPDGSITGLAWQWASSADQNQWSDISGAASATFSPLDSHINQHLRVTATYTDGHGSGKSVRAEPANAIQAAPPVNQAPVFQQAAVARSLPEDAAVGTNVGTPVAATDPNPGNVLTYSLSGTDRSSFNIDRSTGQLTTRIRLDYERKPSHTVSVKATDASNASATATVTITVTNVDEAGQLALSTSVPRVNSAVTATLTDPDGGLANVSWQWKLSDTAHGTAQVIAGATGRSHTPTAEFLGKFLWATATYTDGHGAGKTAQSARYAIGTARLPSNTRNNGGNGPDQGPDNGLGNALSPKTTSTIPRNIQANMSSAAYTVQEGDSVRVTVRLSSAASQSLRIPVAVTRGSAEAGDYHLSGLSGRSLSFARGSRSASFHVIAQQDTDAADETLHLRFGNLPQGVSLGAIPRATVFITDDEVPPPLQLSVYYRSTQYAVGEGRSIRVTVRLSADSDRTLAIPVTATNHTAESDDYHISGLTDGALYFGPGARSESFTFTSSQDDDSDDETVILGFGALPEDVLTGPHAGGTVKIEDDDVAVTAVGPDHRSQNSPPVFTEGASAKRQVVEQAARETAVGLPLTATDPDGDTLTYFVAGPDASYFSVDSLNGQLRTYGVLDLEVKPTYDLAVTVSDGRGGMDSITVTITLADVQEVPITSPSSQSVGLVDPKAPFSLETPDGTAAIHIPQDFTKSPLFVRLESAAVNCAGQWPGGEDRALFTLQVFDTLGDPVSDIDLKGAVAAVRFDSLALGGDVAANAAHQNGAVQVHRYQEKEGDWSSVDFFLEVDELGVVAITVRDLNAPFCLAAVTRSADLTQPQTGAGAVPENEAMPNDPGATFGKGRRRASDPESSDNPAAVMDAGDNGNASGGHTEGETMVIAASMGGGPPWWPSLFLVLGSTLLIGAVTWQFRELRREKSMWNKTFSKARKSQAEDIFRS